MVLSNNKIILAFGFDREEAEALNKITSENKLPGFKILDNSMASMKIKDIIDGLKLEVYNDSLPKEKVILFNNLEDEELNLAIREIRQKISSKPIFAVVTETSREWTFSDLLAHLIEEREWYRKKKTKSE